MQLNLSQRSAAHSPQRRLLILAGAGTGKTSTCVARYSYFLQELKLTPSELLLITFTRKAGNEIKERILHHALKNDLIEVEDANTNPIQAFTFHGWASQLLRIDPHNFGLQRQFSVLESSERQELWSMAYRSSLARFKPSGLAGEKDIPTQSDIAGAFSYAINTLRAPYEVFSQRFADQISLANQTALTYSSLKEDSGVVDYDDLLLLLANRLDRDAGYANRLRSQYRGIIVDEFQDNNPLQERLLRLISPEYLTLVGDRNQSIYSWRGADPSLIDRWIKEPAMVVSRLEENYRSAQCIVNLANDTIAGDPLSLQLRAHSNAEGQIRVLGLADQECENTRITEWLTKCVEAGRLQEGVVVLARTSKELKSLEPFLRAKSIPYDFKLANSVMERDEVKDFMSLCRFVVNPRDKLSLRRCMKMIKDSSSFEIESFLGSIQHESPMPALPTKYSLLTDLSAIIQADNLSFIAKMDTILSFYSHLPRSRIGDWEQKRAVLGRVIEGSRNNGSLENFIDGLSMANDDDATPALRGVVLLSTIHASKGGEWRNVWIKGMGSRQMPHPLSEVKEEERRLFYVAATRAKETLIISYPKQLISQGGKGRPYSQEITPYMVADR